MHNGTCIDSFSPYTAEIFLYKPWRPKFFVQFEIIINDLVKKHVMNLVLFHKPRLMVSRKLLPCRLTSLFLVLINTIESR